MFSFKQNQEVKVEATLSFIMEARDIKIRDFFNPFFCFESNYIIMPVSPACLAFPDRGITGITLRQPFIFLGYTCAFSIYFYDDGVLKGSASFKFICLRYPRG